VANHVLVEVATRPLIYIYIYIYIFSFNFDFFVRLYICLGFFQRLCLFRRKIFFGFFFFLFISVW
jgi:hypothetical protein